jgi:hypothetical protein
MIKWMPFLKHCNIYHCTVASYLSTSNRSCLLLEACWKYQVTSEPGNLSIPPASLLLHCLKGRHFLSRDQITKKKYFPPPVPHSKLLDVINGLGPTHVSPLLVGTGEMWIFNQWVHHHAITGYDPMKLQESSHLNDCKRSFYSETCMSTQYTGGWGRRITKNWRPAWVIEWASISK